MVLGSRKGTMNYNYDIKIIFMTFIDRKKIDRTWNSQNTNKKIKNNIYEKEENSVEPKWAAEDIITVTLSFY